MNQLRQRTQTIRNALGQLFPVVDFQVTAKPPRTRAGNPTNHQTVNGFASVSWRGGPSEIDVVRAVHEETGLGALLDCDRWPCQLDYVKEALQALDPRGASIAETQPLHFEQMAVILCSIAGLDPAYSRGIFVPRERPSTFWPRVQPALAAIGFGPLANLVGLEPDSPDQGEGSRLQVSKKAETVPPPAEQMVASDKEAIEREAYRLAQEVGQLLHHEQHPHEKLMRFGEVVNLVVRGDDPDDDWMRHLYEEAEMHCEAAVLDHGGFLICHVCGKGGDERYAR